jgi:ribosomal protein L11 methylase PrmA
LKAYPALEIRAADPDRLYAAIDDFSPTALEERTDSIRVFFSTTSARDNAQSALAPEFHVAAIDVPDEDWARRSQADLQPVTVGRLTISPRVAASPPPPLHQPPRSFHLRPSGFGGQVGEAGSAASPEVVVITPSMGFGTGHHATTRLCLAALQTLDLSHLSVLDVGTGSGVLAIAADRLGAARALGIDHDPDAVQAARENLALNPTARDVSFAIADLRTTPLPRAGVVTANLTGALLIETATELLGAVDVGGTLIVSGLLASERDEVVRALTARIVWECEEDGWVGLAMTKS